MSDWPAYNWSRDVEPGSILDFSHLLDAPAGKHGRLIVREGHFAFENNLDRKVRFYGVNLCTAANFPEHDEAHRLVDQIAACGYNSVRFHHHDHALTLTTGDRAVELDLAVMDKLDYLFHCCKERGIYLTTDLYVSRRPRQSFAELGRPIANFEEFKFLIYLCEDVYQNWEDFARNFLEHVNPHSGFAWKNDPALVTLNCINEGAIFHCYRDGSADVKRIYNAHFEAWLKSNHNARATREALLNRFLVERASKTIRRMRAFLKSIGAQPLITDQNHWSIKPMSILRQDCDYVDDHFYHDHPERFPLPSKLINHSALTDLFSIFSGIFPGRMFGKPYTISEYNWVYPNQFRYESAPLTAAYAALQDWDGLYRFEYLSKLDEPPRAGYFNIAADPINSLSDRIGVLLFLRGDVMASEIKIPFPIPPNHVEGEDPVNTYPTDFWKQGFVAQLGNVIDSTHTPPPLAASPRHLVDVEKTIATSSTGELHLNADDQSFTIDSPRTALLLFNQSKTLSAGIVSAKADSPSLVFASAMDGKDLPDSRRILLMHLTDAHQHDLVFKDNVIEQWGAGPVQIRPGTVDVSLTLPSRSFKLFALSPAGARENAIPITIDQGRLRFTLETPALLYELVS